MSARHAREAVAAALSTAGVFVVAHPATLDPVDSPTAYVGLADYDAGTATGCASAWRVPVVVAVGDPTVSPAVWDALDDAGDDCVRALTLAGIHVTSNTATIEGDRLAVRTLGTESYA